MRVDGAVDEAPSHEEVQFLWTARHYEKGYVATLISARNSGASYLNRVELQNGCLAQGHANLFIPSTLSGTNIDPKTGKLDPERFRRNMKLATEVYINRVNHCSCGETVIELYEGADSTEMQKLRESLIVYLKGTKVNQEKLKTEQRDLYDYFQKIWELRNRHLIHKDIPLQYLFFLVCCFQPGTQFAKPTRTNQNYPVGLKEVLVFPICHYPFLILTGLGGLPIVQTVMACVVGTTSSQKKLCSLHILLWYSHHLSS